MTQLLASTPDATLIQGGPKTGKTSALIKCTRTLLENQAAPESIAFIVASPTAQLVMNRKLHEAGLSDIGVYTAREIALRILQTPEVEKATGRHGHMLSGYEESFLMEDMKACGLRPKRIREMLRFFYRSWTELAHLEGNWFVYKEEEEVYSLLKSLLVRNRAYIEPELSANAYAVLKENSALLNQHTITHVLVDDYQTLSRASQFLVNLLAQESIAIAGNPYASCTVFDTYPYAKGFDEFLETNAHATVAEQKEAYTAPGAEPLLNTLRAHAMHELQELEITALPTIQTAPGDAAFDPCAYDSPQDEIAAAQKWVEQRIAEGLAPHDIIVATPNRTWERHVCNALTDAGIPCDSASTHRNACGDVRYPQTSREARMLCLLKLAADPRDEASLRAWCGFGDYLTNSQVFTEIDAYAKQNNLSLHDTLEQMVDPEKASMFQFEFNREANKVCAVYLQLKDYLSQLEDLTGQELIERACGLASVRERMEAPQAIAKLVELQTGSETAQELRVLIEKRQAFPTVVDEGVKVVPYAWTVGLQAKAACVMGMINGFIPPLICFDTVKTSPEMAERLISRAAREAIAACGAAETHLAVSYFNEIDYDASQTLRAKAERIYARDDVRYAKTSPSVLLDNPLSN